MIGCSHPAGDQRQFRKDTELFNGRCKRYHNLRSDAWSDEAVPELLSMYEAQISDVGPMPVAGSEGRRSDPADGIL